MPHTLDSTSEAAAQAKGQFERFSGRLLHLLSFTPEGKLLWAPSPTAKSPLRIVAHCALTSRFFADIITERMAGNMPSAPEFFQGLQDGEAKIVTRESAIALVNETTAELVRAIDTINDANIDAPRDSPFGPIPIRFWMAQGAEQMAGHAGQLEYLQTMWGDLDNHFN